MVDLNDVKSLEDKFRDEANYLTVPERNWATMVGIPDYIRIPTIKTLYLRYKDEENLSLVRKMCKSKCGLHDTERYVHEKIIRQYPDWQYEVAIPIGSVDFVTDTGCIVEVKTAASWKQCCVLSLYRRYFDYNAQLIAALFGTVRPDMVENLQWLGYTVARVASDGCLEYFEDVDSHDEPF